MRRSQPNTISQNFYNNPCPLATMITLLTTRSLQAMLTNEKQAREVELCKEIEDLKTKQERESQKLAVQLEQVECKLQFFHGIKGRASLIPILFLQLYYPAIFLEKICRQPVAKYPWLDNFFSSGEKIGFIPFEGTFGDPAPTQLLGIFCLILKKNIVYKPYYMSKK